MAKTERYRAVERESSKEHTPVMPQQEWEASRQRLLKERMAWKMPWYTITDSFDKDFGVDEWHGHNMFIRDGHGKIFRTYFINNRGDESMGTVWSYLDVTPLGRQEAWEDSPEGYPQTLPYRWWNWHDNYAAETAPNAKWIDILSNPQEAARKRTAEEKERSNSKWKGNGVGCRSSLASR